LELRVVFTTVSDDGHVERIEGVIDTVINVRGVDSPDGKGLRVKFAMLPGVGEPGPGLDRAP